jgi:hypothetical protein
MADESKSATKELIGTEEEHTKVHPLAGSRRIKVTSAKDVPSQEEEKKEQASHGPVASPPPSVETLVEDIASGSKVPKAGQPESEEIKVAAVPEEKTEKKKKKAKGDPETEDTFPDVVLPQAINVLRRGPGNPLLYLATPRPHNQSRAQLMIQFLLASETGQHLNEFQSYITEQLEYVKPRPPMRFTIVIDPLVPNRPHVHVGEGDHHAVFKESVKYSAVGIYDGLLRSPETAETEQAAQTAGAYRILDLHAPSVLPVGDDGVKATINTIQATLHNLRYGERKDDTQLFAPQSPYFLPCHMRFVREELAMEALDKDADAKIVTLLDKVTQAIDTASVEKRRLDDEMLKLTQRLSNPEERAKIPDASKQLEELAAQIKSCAETTMELQKSLHKKLGERYIKQMLEGNPLDFFNLSKYHFLRTGLEALGTCPLAADDGFVSQVRSGGPLAGVGMLAALSSSEMICLRVIYLGDQDWSDMLEALPPLPTGEDQEDARFEGSRMYDRLAQGRLRTLEYYHEELKRMNKAAGKGMSQEQFDALPEAARTAIQGEADRIARATVPRPEWARKPTVIHCAMPMSLFADFCQATVQLRSGNDYSRRQYLMSLVRKKQESIVYSPAKAAYGPQPDE